MTRNFAAKAVHKYMYPATYNFRDEADATSGTDIGLIDTTQFTDSTYSGVITASEDGHRKVFQVNTSGDNGTYAIYWHDFSSNQTTGTVEFWWKCIDNGTGSCYFLILSGSANKLVQIQYDNATNLVHAYHAATSTTVAKSADTWIHIRVQFDTDTDHQWVWVDGVALISDVAFYLSGTAAYLDRCRWQTYGAAANDDLDFFVDAYGESWDTDYAIGDNCFWRHYKESEADTFEEDDVGTQGTSITWVDTVDTAASFEIINEFNEHKKILRGYYSSAVGGYDKITHTPTTQTKNAWFEWWWKVSDVTGESKIYLYEDATAIITLYINASKFQYWTHLAAWADVGLAAVNDTWYHCYLELTDAANDTFDLYIDNVLYKDDTQCRSNMTSGVNSIQVWTFGAADYQYIDAFTTSLDGDSRADNRIFDYNDAYTREDITTATQNVIYSNVLHGWRTATLYSKTDYDHDRVFLQIYDINSILALEAEIINRVQKSEIRTYTLLDKNYDDLASLSSNTFSADDLHDPTDSTCMLKTVLPNVSELDGDLILVNADVKTDTYSTVTKNYPDGDFLRDISDLSDSCVIIEANGKCHLDDDLASGDSLDFDTAADHSKMTGEPKVNDILDTINYFEIFGAINPLTGARWYKITDNSGDDRKRKWRIINNAFRNQTDLDAYAAKLVAKLVSVKEITINVQGLGAHNMGTLFTYKYDNDVYTIPSAAYYVISETIDFDTAAATILLSEGLIEVSKYAEYYERPQNYSDTDMGQIYETERVTIDLTLRPGAGTAAWWYYGIKLPVLNDSALADFYTDAYIAVDRGITLDFVYRNGSHGARTTDGLLQVYRYDVDGSNSVVTVVNNESFDPIFTANQGHYHMTRAITTAVADQLYQIWVTNKETDNGNATELTLESVQVRYYKKRVV